MNELELFTEWFIRQNRFDIVKRKDNYSGSIPFNFVLENYWYHRDEIVIECIIAKTLTGEGMKQDKAIAVAEQIMKKIDKLDEDVM